MAYFKTIEDKSGAFVCAVNRSTSDIFECKKKSNTGNDDDEEGEG
jgi:hypothetical protein